MYTLDEKFETIIRYLGENPEYFSARAKNIIEFGINIDNISLKNKFIDSRNIKKPSQPATIPDEAVSLIMNQYYDIEETELEKVSLEHQFSMISENIVGELLERYLASILEDNGWVWCSGEFVKSIDFIKETEDGWITLQVKNRNTTENSSSSSVRKGTTIMKWFRSFARKSELNWDKFPDSSIKHLLSEEGFRDFIHSHLERAKQL